LAKISATFAFELSGAAAGLEIGFTGSSSSSGADPL